MAGALDTEIEKLKKQLELSEVKFRKVAETASDAIIIADEDSVIFFCNPKACELFGYSEEEMIGTKLTQLMPEKYREAHLKGMKRFVSTHVPKLIGHTIEIEALKKDNSIVPIELSLSAWKENEDFYFSGIIRDITERYRIQQEMELIRKLSAAISKSDSFINALRITTKTICQQTGWDCGEAWMLNKDKNTISYLPVWYISDEKYKSFVEESKQISIKVGDGLPGRVFANNVEWIPNITLADFRRKEAAEKAGLKAAFGVPIVTHEGEVFAGLIFYFREKKEEDVFFRQIVSAAAIQLGTFLEKKLAEEAVRKSRDFYLSILDDFPALIWRADEAGDYNYFNRTWLKFTGKNLAAEKGNGWIESIHPEDLEHFYKRYINAFNHRRSFELQYRLKRFDGEYRWMNSFGSPFYHFDGSFGGYIGTCYDVSEQREKSLELNKVNRDLKETNEELRRTEELLKEMNVQLETKVELRTQELKNQNEDLIKINSDMDNFIYTASHDLKAPISNIEGLVSAAINSVSAESVDKNDILDLLEMMHLSVSKFKRTIEGLTEISKIQKLRNEDITTQNLLEIIDDAKVMLSDLIKEAEPEIQLDLSTCKPIRFSTKNIRSIIYNLLSNALKYRSMERSLILRISCTVEEGFVVISFEDNGLGIDLHKAKLFKMFKRFHTHVEGTGIGLYIIKRIIEDAGGKIEVDSNLGEGTEFKVYFPV